LGALAKLRNLVRTRDDTDGDRLLLVDNRLADDDGRRPIHVGTASLEELMMK